MANVQRQSENEKAHRHRGGVGEEGCGLKYFETESLWASVNNAARIFSCRSKSFCIEDFSKCTFVHSHDIDPGSIKLFALILSTVFTTKTDRQIFADCARNCYLALDSHL